MGYSSKKDALDDTGGNSSSTRRPGRRPSFFGKLSVLVGLVAFFVVCRERFKELPGAEYLYHVRDYKVEPLHVAAAGAGLAVLALLWRAVSARTRAGWPILGLLVCASAAGTWRYITAPMTPGSPELWVRDNVVNPLQQKIEDYRKGKSPVTPEPKTVEVSTPAEPKADAPKIETPKVETPKIETPKVAEPATPEPEAPKSKLFKDL